MSDLPAGVEAKGGGYYLLSDGSTVRGRDAAVEAAKRLTANKKRRVRRAAKRKPAPLLPGKPHATGPAARRLAAIRSRRR